MILGAKYLTILIIFAFISLELAAQDNSEAQKMSIAFQVDEKDLIPEGISYDPETEMFFISSIYKKKVISIDREGNHYDFVVSGQDSMAQSLGLKVDVERRRLWILSNEESHRYSFVHIYNIDTKKLLKKFSTTVNDPHTLNDLVLTREGAAYITDTESNRLYYVPADLTDFKLFTSWDCDCLINEINGITISPDNSTLYVASSTDIKLVNIEKKSTKALENWLSVDTRGIDGLMIYKNSLIGIRNGVAGLPGYHVVRYYLNPNGTEIIKAELLDHKSELIEIPTTGVIVDESLYCLGVTSLGVHIMKKMNEVELLRKPAVLKYYLN